jgi:hypothetical protein
MEPAYESEHHSHWQFPRHSYSEASAPANPTFGRGGDPRQPWLDHNWPGQETARPLEGCVQKTSLGEVTMPNCDFLAAGPDHRAVLEFVLGQADCRVYELYSEFDQPLFEFRTLADFEKHYSILDWNALHSRQSMLLQLYPPNASGKFVKHRIALDSRRCKGATFRYESSGWGLIQLYLQSPIKRTGKQWLEASHTNHNSERRARAWESTYPELGPVSAWNWPVVTSFSRRLNRYIHKLAVAKIGSYAVLPFAAQLKKSGIPLGQVPIG